MRTSLALAGVAAAASVAAGAPRAHAEGDLVATMATTPRGHQRVVLVSMPDPVFAATASALGPWSIAVEATGELPPTDDVAAAEMARVHGATAVAWLEGPELVIYDDLRGVSERRAAPEAVDDVAAATIALSIKTSLRRPVVVAAAPAAPPERPPVEVDAAPARVEVAIAPLRAARRAALHVTARVGAGLPLADPMPTMPRVGGRISLDLPFEPRLAIAAGAEAGPSASIANTEFAGRYRDLTFTVGAEWRQELAGRFWLVPSLSGTMHLTRLEGTVLMPNPREISEAAYPFGAEVELAVETGGRLRGGAAVYCSVMTGRDRYKVRGEDVLVVPAATLGANLRISFQ